MTDYSPTAIGLFPGLPEDVYRRDPAVNVSALKEMRRSPAHARYARDNESEPTPAMILGKAAHALILEPERYAERVAVAPKINRRTNAGKDEWSAFQVANAGKIILSVEDAEAVEAMAHAVVTHPEAQRWLRIKAHSELSAFWIDKQTGLRCKGRIDRYAPGHFGLEIKTTTDASPRAFERTIEAQQYHVQNAMYLWGIGEAGAQSGSPMPSIPDPIFIVVESSPPYGVAVYRLDERAAAIGAGLLREYLDLWAIYSAKNYWPSYAEDLQVIGLPPWARSVDDE